MIPRRHPPAPELGGCPAAQPVPAQPAMKSKTRRPGLHPPRRSRTAEAAAAGAIVGRIGQPGDASADSITTSILAAMLAERDAIARLGDRAVVRITTKPDGTVILRERRIYHGHRLLAVEQLP